MYTFIVNGREVHTDKETNLLAFLREDMGLTSVKNGCAKGACGACTVLVDGKTCVRVCCHYPSWKARAYLRWKDFLTGIKMYSHSPLQKLGLCSAVFVYRAW